MDGIFDDKIVQGDVLNELRKVPSKTFNFAFTSPPYNLKNSTGNGMKDGRGGKWANAKLINGYTDHHDQMPHEEYVAWQRNVITEVMRTLKDDGAFFYNHKWRVQGGLIQDRSDIVEGFPVRQIIIWQRSGGINFNKGANKLGDIWKINQDIKNPHPASFPIGLAMNVIKSCPGDLVLDPFMGSGTTAAAAKLCGKNYFGIELSKEYIELAEKRLEHVSKFGEDLNWRKKNDSGQQKWF
jgi:site-specific DNA-methyltransferase (adenine-specific)